MKPSSNLTYREAAHQAASFLEAKGKNPDVAWFVLDDWLDWDLTARIRHKNDPMPEFLQRKYARAINQIATEARPYQYVTGRAWFYRYPFMVTPATLIPRQETEQLVTLVLDAVRNGSVNANARVLDIGTGCGAIAIALKKECPTFDVTGTDISKRALAVAKSNGARLGASVRWLAGDLFQPVAGERFDVIMTNPPYIAYNDWPRVGVDVRRYEPPRALFAGDAGYAFYERLMRELPMYLAPDGIFLAECGDRQGETLAAHFQAAFPKRRVQIVNDMNEIPRILTLSKEDSQ